MICFTYKVSSMVDPDLSVSSTSSFSTLFMVLVFSVSLLLSSCIFVPIFAGFLDKLSSLNISSSSLSLSKLKRLFFEVDVGSFSIFFRSLKKSSSSSSLKLKTDIFEGNFLSSFVCVSSWITGSMAGFSSSFDCFEASFAELSSSVSK